MNDFHKKAFTAPVAAHCKELSAVCDEISERHSLPAPQVALSLSTMIAALVMENYPASERRAALDAINDMIEAELEQMEEFDAKDAASTLAV